MKAILLGFLLMLAQQGMGPGPGTPHATGGGGGIAFVQASQAFTTVGGTTVAATVTSSTSGNFLVAVCGAALGSGTMTLSDNLGNTWIAATGTHETTLNYSIYPFYLANNPGGVTTVTCTSGASAQLQVVAEEFSGVVTSSPLDGTQQNATSRSFATPAVWSTPSITTTHTADLLIATTGNRAAMTYSAGSGWTLPTNGQSGAASGSGNVCIQYQIVASTGTYSSSGSSTPGGNSNFLSSLFAFK